MKEKIEQELAQIERDHDVHILWACESGSRAWGFPSQDSDYDVRFLYVHPRDWYLSVFDQRDVIEIPIHDLIDSSGWDVRKALGLLCKSNSALFEWLSSPILYRAPSQALLPFSELARRAFLPHAACISYLSMSRQNMAAIGRDETTSIKRYLYALRTLLCCKWVVCHGTRPPILLQGLLEALLSDGEIRSIIDDLLERKSLSDEIDRIPRSSVLENFIAKEQVEIADRLPVAIEPPPATEFDAAFRAVLLAIDGK